MVSVLLSDTAQGNAGQQREGSVGSFESLCFFADLLQGSLVTSMLRIRKTLDQRLEASVVVGLADLGKIVAVQRKNLDGSAASLRTIPRSDLEAPVGNPDKCEVGLRVINPGVNQQGGFWNRPRILFRDQRPRARDKREMIALGLIAIGQPKYRLSNQ